MPNYFEEKGISQEDEEVIRSILANNTISEKEVRSISFEQSKYLNELKFDLMNYGTENDVPVAWLTGELLSNNFGQILENYREIKNEEI